MLQHARHSSFRLLGLAAGLVLVTAGAPAFGQDFTVIGRGDSMHERTLSASINHADLDLTTKVGRTVLRQRIRRTAAKLCRQLDDASVPPGLGFECEDAAVAQAAPLERALIAQAHAATQDQATAMQAASFGRVASATPSR